ncbi:hypothetical protein [Mesorhizobium argentiipisi]|uniref:Uncharacterized protein n=1 Tax=Mesorhizobium argentiipisi TaxID=3015175 RepID=A0ABU8KIK9_9HYPH
MHEDSGKPLQSVDHLVSEMDHLFGYGHFAKPNKLILLMHERCSRTPSTARRN